jgi:hypothetical protein
MKPFAVLAALLLSTTVALSQSTVSSTPSVINFPYTSVGSSRDTNVTISIYMPYVSGSNQCYIEIKSPAGFTFKTPCFTTFVSDGQNCPGWSGGDGHFSLGITVRYTPTSSAGNNGSITLDLYRGSQYANPPVDAQATIIMSSAPLPVQLTSFRATPLSGNGISLNWTTASETNNFGFYVQRRGPDDKEFAQLPGSFVAGHGTTIAQHQYSYLDATGAFALNWYRLQQIDLDGAVDFSEPVQVGGVTDVRDEVPTAYGLAQNYPNPFNPSTTIRYGLPARSHVTLSVFNTLGQQVSVLQNGEQESGFHEVRFDAANLSSGVYLYRIQAGNFVQTRKLLLVR